MLQLPPSEVGAGEARDLADRVLSGRAYVEANRGPSLQDRFFNWIADQIGDLLGSLSSAGGRGWTAWLIIIFFALLIAFLLSRLFRHRGAMRVDRSSAEPIIDVIGGRNAEEWMAAAVEAESGGDWRLGLRCRHRSLAASLLGKGLITDRAGQTAGEIHRAVAAQRPMANDALQEATWLFKDAWYGWVEADVVTRDRFVALADQVLLDVDHEQMAAT